MCLCCRQTTVHQATDVVVKYTTPSLSIDLTTQEALYSAKLSTKRPTRSSYFRVLN